MAIKKPKEEKLTDSIVNLAALQKEFLGGKMDPKKTVALREKLISLFSQENASEAESKLLEMILKKERLKGFITDKNVEVINGIEAARCEESCIVTSDHPPLVHFLSKDLVCKHSMDYDNDKHIVFVPVTRSAEEQMSMELARKLDKGFPTTPKDYEPPRKLLHKLSLTQAEFDAWFDLVNEEILNETIGEEPVYKF